METLEAEVRSKFQTSRRMTDATQGEVVEVPFDEALVRYYWRGERVFEVVGVELRAKSKLAEMERLLLVDEGAAAESGATTTSTSTASLLEEGAEVVIEEPAY